MREPDIERLRGAAGRLQDRRIGRRAKFAQPRDQRAGGIPWSQEFKTLRADLKAQSVRSEGSVGKRFAFDI